MKLKLLSFFGIALFTILPLIVNAQTDCLPPANSETASVNQTGATFAWSAVAGTQAYVVRYRPVPTGTVELPWITVTTQTNNFAVTNLTCGTTYQWQVATHCISNSNSTVLSSFSPIRTFTTLACNINCLPPTNFETSAISQNSATLSWSTVSGTQIYVIRFRPVPTAGVELPWITITVQGNSFTLANLNCGITYQWQVASHCISTSNNVVGLSNYSPIRTFTTLTCSTPCVSPINAETTSITQTGATFVWSAVPGIQAYVLRYRPVPTSTLELPWIVVTVQTNNFVATNLTCGTAYQWQVASHCLSTNNTTALTNYTPIRTFTTLACQNVCTVPSGLTSTSADNYPTGKYLHWNATNAHHYNIRYKKVDTSDFTIVSSTTNSKVITSLTTGQYVWQVQSICTNDTVNSVVSPWSIQAYFSINVQSGRFPNPVTDNRISIPILVENEAIYHVLITDQFGKTVKNVERNISSGEDVLDLDITDIRNGIYFIQINGNGSTQTQKIIIMK